MDEKPATATDDASLAELDREIRTERFVDPNPVTAAAVLSGATGARAPEQILLDAVELAKRDLPPDATPEVQTAVAELLRMMEVLVVSARPVTRMAMAEFALHRLLKAPNDLTLANKVIADLRKASFGRIGLWLSRARAATPPHVDVVLGLGLAVLVFGVVFLFGGFNAFRAVGLTQQLASDEFLQSLVWLGAVGAFGSVISILTRLNDFAQKVHTSAWLDFMNGFFKPVIGLASADLAFVLIEARIVPLDFASPETTRFALIGIAFVAGFSERLVHDLASIVERSIGAAGERGIELQRTGMGPAARAEIAEGLSGRTEVSRAEIYDSVDLNELDEAVNTTWEETEGSIKGGS